MDVGPLVAAIEDGSPVTTGERVSAKNVLAALPGLPVLDAIAERLDAHSDGQRAAAVELALSRGCTWPSASTRPLTRAKASMAEHHSRSSRYSRYTGGPDPLAPPVDLRMRPSRSARTMEGTPSQRPAELMRRGWRTCPAPTSWRPRGQSAPPGAVAAQQSRRHLQEIKKLLDEAVLAERKELARALDDDARFGEMQLSRCRRRRPRPSRSSPNDWRSDEARQKYEDQSDLLGREMLDQRFAGMKEALENATDEDRRRVNDMLDDLNDLLDKARAGQ